MVGAFTDIKIFSWYTRGYTSNIMYALTLKRQVKGWRGDWLGQGNCPCFWGTLLFPWDESVEFWRNLMSYSTMMVMISYWWGTMSLDDFLCICFAPLIPSSIPFFIQYNTDPIVSSWPVSTVLDCNVSTLTHRPCINAEMQEIAKLLKMLLLCVSYAVDLLNWQC